MTIVKMKCTEVSLNAQASSGGRGCIFNFFFFFWPFVCVFCFFVSSVLLPTYLPLHSAWHSAETNRTTTTDDDRLCKNKRKKKKKTEKKTKLHIQVALISLAEAALKTACLVRWIRILSCLFAN